MPYATAWSSQALQAPGASHRYMQFLLATTGSTVGDSFQITTNF
jgi:hypothetical protein